VPHGARGRIRAIPALTLVVERTTWTDERLDDAVARIEQRFEAVDRRFDRVDDDFSRVWTEFGAVRREIGATNRLVAQIGWALVGVFLAQTIAAIVALVALA
jgi:hypothetical protein